MKLLILSFLVLTTINLTYAGAFKSVKEEKKEVELGPYQINGKHFPKHWGEPPKMQTMDYRPLPGDYGNGSGTLARWIQMNMDKDNESK